jgi:hypothetical protein
MSLKITLTLALVGATLLSYSQNTGIGTLTPGSKLEIRADNCDNTKSALNVKDSCGNSLLFVYNSGRVGIGSNTPGYRLSVNGISAIADRTIGINGVPIAYLPDQSTSLFNSSIAFGNGLRNLNRTTSIEGQSVTAVGIDALVSNTTGFQNTALGYNAANATTTGYNNVAIGANTLSSNITGTNNIAVGEESMYSASGNFNIAFGSGSLKINTGDNNLAIGYNSLRTNGAGTQNTGIGLNALYSTTTGSYNTGIGSQALMNNTTGIYNIGIGQNAVLGNTSGSNNIGIGSDALASNGSGDKNVGIGTSALKLNNGGTQNFAAGNEALYHNIGGGFNLSIGNEALWTNVSGGSNVAYGYKSLYFATTSYNTAIGVYALTSTTSGANNTALGYRAGSNITTGSFNIHIGYFPTASNITTGSNNILIGQDVYSGTSATASNQLNIGNLLYGTGLSSANTLSTGNIGVGTASPTYKFHVNGGNVNGEVASFQNSTYQTFFLSNATLSAYNPLTQASDNGIYWRDRDGTTPLTANGFVIGPWSTSAKGIRIDGATGNLGVGVITAKSTLEVNGSVGYKIATKTANYTAADDAVILTDATSATITISLPAASTATGRMYIIKKITAANSVIIDPNGSELLDGATTQTLTTTNQRMNIISNGTAWYIIN